MSTEANKEGVFGQALSELMKKTQTEQEEQDAVYSSVGAILEAQERDAQTEDTLKYHTDNARKAELRFVSQVIQERLRLLKADALQSAWESLLLFRGDKQRSEELLSAARSQAAAYMMFERLQDTVIDRLSALSD